VARTLAAEGALSAWRNERYAVAAAPGAPPWFLLERAAARVAESGADPRAHATWLASRPPEVEDAAIAMLIDRCRAAGKTIVAGGPIHLA